MHQGSRKIQQHNNDTGQGIVEYILITAFVALAAIAIFKAFRQDVGTAYKKAGEALVQGVDSSLNPDPGVQ